MIFLKDFNLSRELELYKMNLQNVDQNIKLKMYGLIGEERVYYSLNQCNCEGIVLYNVRVKEKEHFFQNDFIIISHFKVIIFEVKNWMDNVRINKDYSVDRIIHRKDRDEVCGVINPIYQLNEQIRKMQNYLCELGYKHVVSGYIIMANEKTKIIDDANYNHMIMYTKICEIINKEMTEKTIDEDYKLAELLMKRNKEYDFRNFRKIGEKMLHSVYVPQKMTYDDYQLYCKMLKIRERLHREYDLPIHYIFTNKEAENMVKIKPKNKEEFIRVPGFKEKRYLLFGEEIIKLFK